VGVVLELELVLLSGCLQNTALYLERLTHNPWRQKQTLEHILILPESGPTLHSRSRQVSGRATHEVSPPGDVAAGRGKGAPEILDQRASYQVRLKSRRKERKKENNLV